MKGIRSILVGAFLPMLALAGCSTPGGSDTGNPLSRAELLMNDGIRQLGSGEYEKARATFTEVLTLEEPGYTCRAQYGIVLAGVQDTADRLDTIADSAALFLGGAPAFRPQASIDFVPIIKNVLEPFESFFVDIMGALDQVVANGCSITLPEGMPVEVGNPNSLIYFKARFGNEFDSAAARAGQIIFSSALASIRMILAHDFEIDIAEITSLLDTLADAAAGTIEMEIKGPGDVTQHTMIYALRSLGAIPAGQDRLLSLGDVDRFQQVDNDLTRALRAFYFRDDEGETGLLPQLIANAKNDPDPTDNFLSYVDADADGTVSEGDYIIVGLRELHIAGVFAQPSVEQGVWLTFNRGIGNISKIVEALHEIAQVLGDQMASVEDDTMSYRRLGLGEINQLIHNVTLLDMVLSPLPEAVELDVGAYFKKPIGIRELFPYWVDHDNDPDTPAEFLIEGESWVTSATEPYVFYGDSGHFAGSYQFKANSSTAPVALKELSIDPDGIEPQPYSVLVPFPLPYIAYQDPTFNGVLFVDQEKLYGAPSDAASGMAPATNFSANMATASYFSFVMNEWVYSK